MKATITSRRRTTMMTSPPFAIWALVALLLGTAPQQTAAQSLVCPPSCGPFGECVACGLGDNCAGQFCRCEAGYEGDDCSLKVEYCPKTDAPGSVPSCRNGGHCVAKEIMENPDGFGMGEEVWRCDCTTAIGAASNPIQHSGAQCEFPSTQSCLAGGIDSTYAFCVNGGDCVRKITRDEEHPGCVNCPGFEGRHCQYREGEAPPEELAAARQDLEDEENEMKPGFIVLFVLLACLVLGCFAMFIVRQKAARDEGTQAAVAHASDVPTDLKLEESGQTDNNETTQPTAHDSEEDEVENPTKPEVV